MSRTSCSPVRAVACLLALAAMSALATNTYAQVPAMNASPLQGQVRDAHGMPLLGAFVAVIALGSDQPAAIVVTDSQGTFRVPNLRHGVYSLLVGSLGFTGTVVQGINVPSAVPLTLQLQPASERELSALDGPLDMNWAMRSSKRDVLRQTDATVVTELGETTPAPSDRWGTGAVSSLTGAVAGEFRLWSFTRTGDHETVGVTSLQLGSGDRWNLTAHVGDGGALWAAGDLTRDLGNGHSLQVGFGYVGARFDPLSMVGEVGEVGKDEQQVRDGRVGKVEAYDRWQILQPLSVRYGIRYENHNYLADTSLVSPSIEMTFAPSQDTRVTTGVSVSERGLDLVDNANGFDVMSLLGYSNLRVADASKVRPEHETHYSLGIERRIGDAEVRVKAYYDEVTDELLGVYVADADGTSNYLLFNLGNSSSHGFELGVAGELMDSLSGQFVYAYRDRSSTYALPRPQQLGGLDLSGFELNQTHELQASVAAELAPSHTVLTAVYNWRQGMPVVRSDGQVTNEYGRFDLKVRQLLPFRALDTEWSAMVQVRNVLGSEYQGLYDVSLVELLGLTRGIAGGLAVRF